MCKRNTNGGTIIRNVTIRQQIVHQNHRNSSCHSRPAITTSTESDALGQAFSMTSNLVVPNPWHLLRYPTSRCSGQTRLLVCQDGVKFEVACSSLWSPDSFCKSDPYIPITFTKVPDNETSQIRIFFSLSNTSALHLCHESRPQALVVHFTVL
jgi:hypothetical protein